jgi:hypothetical protein
MKQLAAKQMAKKKKVRIDGNHGWKIPGYQRKTWFKNKPAQPDDFTIEMI